MARIKVATLAIGEPITVITDNFTQTGVVRALFRSGVDGVWRAVAEKAAGESRFFMCEVEYVAHKRILHTPPPHH